MGKKKKPIKKPYEDLEKQAKDVEENVFFRRDCYFKEDEEHKDNLGSLLGLICSNGHMPFANNKKRIIYTS